jgi:hypothetical protein
VNDPVAVALSVAQVFDDCVLRLGVADLLARAESACL